MNIPWVFKNLPPVELSELRALEFTIDIDFNPIPEESVPGMPDLPSSRDAQGNTWRDREKML